jgi:hypothetical protein
MIAAMGGGGRDHLRPVYTLDYPRGSYAPICLPRGRRILVRTSGACCVSDPRTCPPDALSPLVAFPLLLDPPHNDLGRCGSARTPRVRRAVDRVVLVVVAAAASARALAAAQVAPFDDGGPDAEPGATAPRELREHEPAHREPRRRARGLGGRVRRRVVRALRRAAGPGLRR